MKVSFNINTDAKDADSGKGKFLLRLSRCMSDLGVDIVKKKADIHLILPCEEMDRNAKVNIVRVDGLILNSAQNYKQKNHNLVKSMKKADAIIYQTGFCEKAYRKFLRIKKEHAIINNGADPNEFLPRDVQNFFIANCKWRPHKRLREIVKCFLIALDNGLDSDLIVTGKPDYVKEHPRIKYVGWQHIDQLRTYLSEAIASLHLTWLDWCPNAMVEAVVAGCPVIYTDSGGHHEIGENAGISIYDKQWDFKPCKLYSPPPIDADSVVNAMLQMKREKPVISKPELYIESIAKRYVEYFRSLLGS